MSVDTSSVPLSREEAKAEADRRLRIATALKTLARYYSGDRNFPVAPTNAGHTARWLIRELVMDWVR